MKRTLVAFNTFVDAEVELLHVDYSPGYAENLILYNILVQTNRRLVASPTKDVDAARKVEGIVEDYEGNPRSNPSSIGAFDAGRRSLMRIARFSRKSLMVARPFAVSGLMSPSLSSKLSCQLPFRG